MIALRSAPRDPAAQSPSEDGGFFSWLGRRFLGRAAASSKAQARAKRDTFRSLLSHPGPQSHPELRAIMKGAELLFGADPVARGAFACYDDAVERGAPPTEQAELLLEVLASLVLHLDMAGQVDVDDLRMVAEKQVGAHARSDSGDAALEAELTDTVRGHEGSVDEEGGGALLSGVESEVEAEVRPSVSDVLHTLLSSGGRPSSAAASEPARRFGVAGQALRPTSVSPRTLAQVHAYLDDVEHRWSRAA